ncbi:MAG: hypothetical protein A3F72_05115 [Bacteroidetes bacterium RIFCSPLOWO2_12_FULL_35_15]|nr:MAG: hypothetical protein A3F72_05115 [Bacteroidetes bacterium RIFCSPLOWO2_12_FULL_35_15]
MVLTIFDLLLTPFYLLLIYFISQRIQKRHIQKQPLYRWYTQGLFAKLGGAIALCLIYQFYYISGDTVNYFYTANAISKVAFKDFDVFFKIMLGFV